MKKAFDQTVRDIRRGVNKKVLKVPSIEQKVLDSTSNEPWGPHGTHLADIAQASRNYHEYQMIMSVIWKRINDTGKNWRHVYKALTVLEYLVANGSERIVDDIREHAYQISTLSTFQYIDSNGRDQGSNVRKKSQSLVAFVNDKERIQEVRQKAAANRDKYRSAQGGLYRPGTGAYDDDRYEDRNGYGDPYGRDGGRYSDEHYGRDGYRDDEYRGRSRSVDGDYGPRSRSSDRERERAYEDDGHYSSRGSNAKADDRSQDGSVGGDRLERKFSEQNLGAPPPPSYEDAAGEGRSPVRSERNGETANINHQETAVAGKPPAVPSPAAAPPPAATPSPAAAPPAAAATAVNLNKENDGFDLFDPRGSTPAAPPASGGAEMDLLGSQSDFFSSNALALVPSTSATSVADAQTNSNPGQTSVAPSSAPGASSQPFDDPFGDGPFRAIPSTDGFSGQPQSTSTQPQSVSAQPQSTSGSGNNFGFGESFNQNTDILADILPPSGPTVPSQNAFQAQPGQFLTSTGFPNQTGQPDYMAQPSQTTFPPSFPGQFGQPMPQHGFQPHGGQPMPPQPGFPAQGGQHMPPQPGFPAQGDQPMPPQPGFPAQGGQHMPPQPGFPAQGGQHMPPQPSFPAQGGQPLPPQPGFPSQNGQPMPPPQHSFQPQGGQQMPPQPGFPVHQGGQNASLGGIPAGFPNSNGQPAQPSNFYGSFQPPVSSAPATAAPAAQYNTSNFYQQTPPITASTGALAIVPQQPQKEKFETKSTVWADTLNRGLVNLNISGSKTNPLSNIGIDFEAINRKEKRMEKPSKTPVTSNVSMGKAMGSGTGIGRAGAGALRAAPSPMVGPGMAMGAPGAGPGYGPAYTGVNQPIGMNNMGQMQQPPAGFQPGSGMAGIYNPAMGRGGGYGPQPYGGYR